MINLTNNAITEVHRIQSTSDQSLPYLRVKVSPGGCAELFYQLEFDQQIDEGDRQFSLADDKIVIVTDSESYQYVEDLTIDYTEDLMGGAFQFQNPKASKQCNCGISFAVD